MAEDDVRDFHLNCGAVNDTVRARALKTNNAIEGRHRGFETTVDINNANIFRLLAALKKEQTLTESFAGEPPARRRKYQDVADHLRTAVNTFPLTQDDDEEPSNHDFLH
jgi:hypothetical protein